MINARIVTRTEDWADFAEAWTSGGIPCLASLVNLALAVAPARDRILVSNGVSSGKLVEFLSRHAAAVVSAEETEAAAALLQRELAERHVGNALAITPGRGWSSFAQDTFDAAFCLLPTIPAASFSEQALNMLRVLRRGGSGVSIAVPMPVIEEAGVGDRSIGDDAAATTAARAVEAMRRHYRTVSLVYLEASTIAPSREAFLSAVFRTSQPRNADSAEVESQLASLKNTYDGATRDVFAVKVVLRAAIVSAIKP